MQHEARRRLGEEHLRALSCRASRWYEQHGLLAEAVEAALTAQDFSRAADLIERIVAPDLVQNEYHTLRRWLEHLPEKVLHAHPPLCMVYAMALLFTSDRRAPTTMALLQTPLQLAEKHWQAEKNAHRLGEVLALRAFVISLQGDRAQALTMAQQALALLPAGESQWRGMSLNLVGMEELLAGKLHTARRILRESHALWQASGNIYGTLVATLGLAELCARQGELHQAAQLYRQVLSEAEQVPMNRQQALSRIGAARLGLGALALEWNDLETAEQHISDVLAISQQDANDELRLRGLFLLARVKHARGATPEAQQLLHELVAQTPQQRWLFLLREVCLYQGRLALVCGDLATVERLITAPQPSVDLARLQQEQEALLVARLRIAQGKAAEALQVLEPWRAEARAQGRVRSELEIMVLQSLVYFAHGDLSQAKATLMQALMSAQAEGYQRLFLDEDEAMVALLRVVWPDVKTDPLVRYVRGLLRAFVHEQPDAAMRPSSEAASLSPESAFLVELLSAQERRVLHLLAIGLSNAEIARELVVSINTVKTQVQSIYRKLGVHSRQAARDAARRLELG